MRIKEVIQEMKSLSKKDMFLLLSQYDSYVREICDREDGSIPVCVAEFFQCEFQEDVYNLRKGKKHGSK